MAESRGKTKIKKKKWVEIVAPNLFNNKTIGEIYVVDPASIPGRNISVNLMNVTNDAKKQNSVIKFIIDDVKENKANTSIVGIKLVPASVKRLARRGKDKIDNSILCKTKDEKIIRIKPLIITVSKTKGTVKKSLIKQSELSIRSLVRKQDFNSIIDVIVSKRFQKELKEKLKKIYPLKICEIRAIEIVTGKKAEKAEKMLKGIKLPKEEPNPKKEESKPEQKAAEEKPTPSSKPKEKKKEEPKEEVKEEPAPAPVHPEDSEDF